MRNKVGAILMVGTSLLGCTESTSSSPEMSFPETAIETTLPPVSIASTVENGTSIPETTTTTTTLSVLTSCVHVVSEGDFLSTIADNLSSEGNSITFQKLAAENAIDPDKIYPGQMLDVCINGYNDILDDGSPSPTTTTTTTTTTLAQVTTPESTIAPDTTIAEEPSPTNPSPPTETVPIASGVAAAQQHTNDVLGAYGYRTLDVDGKYGPLSQQATCLARIALGLPATRESFVPGSPEEVEFLSKSIVVAPSVTQKYSGKWGYVSETCQTQILGEGESIVAMTPVSTGQAEYDTRNGEYAVFLYRPASDNGGWHNSSSYPAAEDNPLNGNMYKPKYFSDGQATHGANNVPPQPASHGCVRTTLETQDFMTTWLGLDAVQDKEYWGEKKIGLTYIIDGAYEYNI